jgi:hypothetical protein
VKLNDIEVLKDQTSMFCFIVVTITNDEIDTYGRFSDKRTARDMLTIPIDREIRIHQLLCTNDTTICGFLKCDCNIDAYIWEIV